MIVNKKKRQKGVFLSKDRDNAKEVLIIDSFFDLSSEEIKYTALQGCAYLVKQGLKNDNTVVIGGGSEKSYAQLELSSHHLTKGLVNFQNNGLVIEGYYTCNGYFLRPTTAAWFCSLVPDGWKTRAGNSFYILPEEVNWQAHKKVCKQYRDSISSKN